MPSTNVVMRSIIIPETANIDANGLDFFLTAIKAQTVDGRAYIQELNTSDYTNPSTLCYLFSLQGNDNQIYNTLLGQLQTAIGASTTLLTWANQVGRG